MREDRCKRRLRQIGEIGALRADERRESRRLELGSERCKSAVGGNVESHRIE